MSHKNKVRMSLLFIYIICLIFLFSRKMHLRILMPSSLIKDGQPRAIYTILYYTIHIDLLNVTIKHKYIRIF